MTRYFLFFCMFFGLSLYAQETKPIAEKINAYHRDAAVFPQYDLFSENPSPEKQNLYRKAATDVSVLKINFESLKKLYKDRPEVVELSIPYKKGKITVELYKENIFSEGFKAMNQERQIMDYTPGVYYRGIVKNDPTSIAAFSIFENELMGMASILGEGNVVVGKAKNASDYLSYTDNSLTSKNPFVCGVVESYQYQKREIALENETAGKASMTNNCVRIYYEVAYQPYLDNGSDVTATLNWLTGVHNNISTLYSNDNINIALSSTLVWTTPDPYTQNDPHQILGYFSGYRTAFYGDLAHLVNSPSTTSVAYLNSICGQSNYAYSGVDQFYQTVPTYSWTIMAMTHEMGHALGSPHTHACAWNGNNTAIDGCGPSAGYDEGCNAPLPSTGGTIMSYCHLTSVGIDLAKGFGSQPGNRIRNTVDGKWCLGTDCNCVATVSDLEISNITTSSATVDIIDNTSTSWKYRVYKYGTKSTPWSNTNSTSFNVSGLLSNTYYILETGNICSSGAVASNFRLIFLTDGNYCNGDKFVDTGGMSGDYENGEHFVKTFYPQVAGDKVLLTFTSFFLEEGYDFMNIYDGEDTDAPIFPNGQNLSGKNIIPGPFQATSTSGAITVKFDSDVGLTTPGWVANLTCMLGARDFAFESQISIYPNPAKGMVNIESREPIENLKVYDMMGSLVKVKKDINQVKTTLSLSDLSTGIYFIRVNIGNHSQVLRIIKN